MKILVISDVHANPAALDAGLDAAGDGYRGILFLGDMTGYGYDPEGCIRRLSELSRSLRPAWILIGNHDAALSGRVPLDWFNPEVQGSVLRTREILSAESLGWLASLPDHGNLGGGAIAFHGSPEQPLVEYLWGGAETQNAFSFMRKNSFRTGFCGHTHEVAVFDAASRTGVRHPAPGTLVSLDSAPVIVNPGSVGFPRSFTPAGEDREPISEASFPAYYAVWDTEACTVRFLAARYDRRPVEEAISRLG